MAMLREQALALKLLTVHFVEGPPSGPPLVLLHGGGGRWQHWLPILPSLAMRWHLFALDLRGHGRSGRVPGQYRPEHYVPDVVAFLEQRAAEPSVLFGHSLGGWIALLVAAELREKVRALILGDPPLCMDRWVEIEGGKESIASYQVLRSLAGSGLGVAELASALADMPVSVPGQEAPMRYGDLPGRNAAHLRGWAKTLSQVDPDVAQYQAEGRMKEYVQDVDLDGALRRLTCPVLLLQADPSHGGVVSDADVEHALSLLADGLSVKLEGAGHDLGLATWKVDPLLRALTDFLESL